MISKDVCEQDSFSQQFDKVEEFDDEFLLFQPDERSFIEGKSTPSVMSYVIDEKTSSLRLDKAASLLFPLFSRSMLEKCIESGAVRVNGVEQKKRYIVRHGDTVSLDDQAIKKLVPPQELTPFPIEFDVIFEDDDLFVINKPPGLVVHPAPGNWDKTVVHGLIHRFPNLQNTGLDPVRPGIVHRLDKDTSGILIIAKNPYSLWSLGTQFQNREVYKEYNAIVHGDVRFDIPLRIETQIDRDKRDRKKMAVVESGGREAITEVLSASKSEKASYLTVRLYTGRTHQIRVHLAHLRHPIIGDDVYGSTKKSAKDTGAVRQMLHCHIMKVKHPRTNEELVFTAPLPSDMIDCLRKFGL